MVIICPRFLAALRAFSIVPLWYWKEKKKKGFGQRAVNGEDDSVADEKFLLECRLAASWCCYPLEHPTS
jgi:hypothetical protein